MANPFAGMSAQQMEDLRVKDPAGFAELEKQLDAPDLTAKSVQYRNGLVVQGAPPPTRPD